MFQVNEYDVKCVVHMNILLFVLTKYVYICRSLTNKVKQAKGQLSPTKLNYIDDNNFKRDMVWEWSVIIMCDYCYYHDYNYFYRTSCKG